LHSPDDIVTRVRTLSGVEEGSGPDNDHIRAAVSGFIAAFDYWYIRVMREAIPKYRSVIVARINPFIRRIATDGMSASEVAQKIISDYGTRNFVTAGGWAIEELAVSVSQNTQKSGAEGIDLQRADGADYHLYVVKSGLITRNSDIIKALKRNARQAEKLLLQGQSTGGVHANYVIAAGKTKSTFEDGIRRPSSAQFWAEILELPEDDAIELALGIAAVAGELVRSDATEHILALQLVLADYICDRKDDSVVDWDFLAKRTMREKASWLHEDKARHVRAMERLKSSGYGEADDAADEARGELVDPPGDDQLPG
jgi:Type II restriction endonuclease EcoO109I